MTTYTQKQGKKQQKWKNSTKSQMAVMKRQNNNARKKMFAESKKDNYITKRSFVRQWKPYFSINVINKKWEKMGGKPAPKRSNPFESLGSLFS